MISDLYLYAYGLKCRSIKCMYYVAFECRLELVHASIPAAFARPPQNAAGQLCLRSAWREVFTADGPEFANPEFSRKPQRSPLSYDLSERMP